MIFLNNRARVWYGAEGNKPAEGKLYAPSAIGLIQTDFPPSR
jgi:hypothetical protein